MWLFENLHGSDSAEALCMADHWGLRNSSSKTEIRITFTDPVERVDAPFMLSNSVLGRMFESR